MDNSSLSFDAAICRSKPGRLGRLSAAGYLSSVSLAALLLIPRIALAADECGVGAVVVCSPAGNPYAGGITYNTNSGIDLSFGPGVVVDAAAGSNGVYVNNNTDGNVRVDTSAGSVTAANQPAVSAFNTAGGVTVITGDVTSVANTAIMAGAWGGGPVSIDTTAGTVRGSWNGIYATSTGALTITTADITATEGTAIFATGYGPDGPMDINTTAGTVTGQGNGGRGIYASSVGALLQIVTADVSTTGANASAISAVSSSTAGTAPVSIDSTAGTLSTQGDWSSGVEVFVPVPAEVRTAAITTAGASSAGIAVYGQQSTLTIDATAGAIQTQGASSAGILASNSSGSTSITAGPITTSGEAAIGIAFTSENDGGGGSPGSTDIVAVAPIMASGANSGGIVARDVGSAPGGAINVTARANITAQGQNSVGLAAGSFAGPVTVTVDPGVTVAGGWSQNPQDLSTGASHASAGSGVVNIGGELPAAGVVLFSGASGPAAARLINNGIIGAMNDRAVTTGFPCADRHINSSGELLLENKTAPASFLDRLASAVMSALIPSAHAATPPASRNCYEGDPGNPDWGIPPIPADPANNLPAVGSITIDNNNLMTGYVTLWDGAAHTFNNNGTFELRHFADTNGDGVRDTKAVSISDFGGPNSTFNNSGTVRFAPVAGAATTDATGYCVPTNGADSRPLEASFYDLTREGVVQGQFVNLQTFNNSGVIDLRGPEIGNTLVMTSNPVAGGAPGTGTFVTNGGQLLVNTRLNDGIAPGGAANSYSDMLIVDRTRMGSGPTSVGVSYDPASAGALTTGNGIEIVEVRDKANSATGVFVLGNRVAGGAYEYTLHHHGVGPDGADGNWYLRSTRIVEPETPPPGPGPAPDPGQTPDPVVPARPIERPNYRVEVPVDAIVPALASRLGMTMIGTLDDRYGPDFAPLSEQAPAPAPAREIWCKDASRNFRCTPTPQQNAYYAGVDQQAPLPAGHLFWARVFGQFGAHNGGGRSDLDRLNAFERNGASYGYRMGGIQFGAHLYRDHLNTAGLYFGYGRIGATVDSVYGEGRAGSVTMDAYSLGGYWTHRRPSGWYVDTVLQGTLYGAVNATSVLGESLNTKGWGLAASLETGYPVALGAGWTLTPQLQAIYQTVGIDGGADRFGQVHYADTQTVYGRLGARLARDFAIEDGRRITAWARVNYWHTFGGNGRATFANLSGGYPVALGAGLGGSWMQFGIGASGQITKDVSLFATGDYNLTVAHGSGQSYTGRVGLQVRW